MRSGVSQRHISFLESGRASPSRDMILRISETLELPLRERNVWLLAVGFAPVFSDRSLDAPEMSRLLFAVRLMLTKHEPFPAVALDRVWNVRLANNAFDRLIGMLGEDLWERVGGGPRNLMRLLFHPNGIRPYVENWPVIAPLLWHRAEREAESSVDEGMGEILSELRLHQSWPSVSEPDEVALLPVLPLRIAHGQVRLSLFTVISTFGTAQDVSASELRMEHLFPADDATEEFFWSVCKK